MSRPPHPRGALVLAALTGLVVAASVAGCSGSAGAPGAASPAPDGLPEGFTVEMYQTRTDTGPRRLEIAITNRTGGPVEIDRLVFDSTQFDGTAEWQKDSTRIVDGATVDLPVLLPPPDCDATDIIHSVEFDYVLDDGTSGHRDRDPQRPARPPAGGATRGLPHRGGGRHRRPHR